MSASAGMLPHLRAHAKHWLSDVASACLGREVCQKGIELVDGCPSVDGGIAGARDANLNAVRQRCEFLRQVFVPAGEEVETLIGRADPGTEEVLLVGTVGAVDQQVSGGEQCG